MIGQFMVLNLEKVSAELGKNLRRNIIDRTEIGQPTRNFIRSNNFNFT